MEPFYKNCLNETFEARRRRNPSYSMRAFARDLGFSAPRLNQILNGKIGLSAESASLLSGRLGLTPEDRDHFRDSVIALHARSPIEKEKAQLRLQKYKRDEKIRQVSLDHFALISDWWHYAILELTTIKGFQSKIPWIANALGITEKQASDALERLERLGMLVKENGRWIATDKETQIAAEIPSATIRAFHEQIIRKALHAIDGQSFEQRELGAITFAVNREDLPELKKEVRRFRRNLTKKFAPGEKDAVYCFATQLIELTLQGDK